MAQTRALAADGRAWADTELQPLSTINAVFGALAKGGVPARMLLQFAG